MDRLTREAIRYLGYKDHKVDSRVLDMIHELFEQIRRVENKKSIYQIYDLNISKDGILRFGTIETNSIELHRNLRNCERIVLFAATLGTEVDRLQSRLSIIDMAKAVILQACATAVLEEYCDECQQNIADELQQQGYHLQSRFSPGYGDFLIDNQKNIVQMLDCSKRIGLTVTDGLMLSPKKSITAVIGLSKTNEECYGFGCEVCENKNCEFRRNRE